MIRVEDIGALVQEKIAPQIKAEAVEYDAAFEELRSLKAQREGDQGLLQEQLQERKKELEELMGHFVQIQIRDDVKAKAAVEKQVDAKRAQVENAKLLCDAVPPMVQAAEKRFKEATLNLKTRASEAVAGPREELKQEIEAAFKECAAVVEGFDAACGELFGAHSIQRKSDPTSELHIFTIYPEVPKIFYRMHR